MNCLSRGILTYLLASSATIPPICLSQQSSAKAPGFQVIETTIVDTQAAIRSGKATCRQLVEIYLNRIRAYDQATRLNTVVTLDPAALDVADRLDKEFARTHKLRPLQGVVMVIKDNYDTK